MHIIIDGCDGCGKTTMTNRLVKEYNLDKVIMTKYGWKAVKSYTEKAFLNNVVSDRSFISEYVYSKVYGRESEITDYVFDTLVALYATQEEPWIFVILNANVDVIMNRVEKRGIDNEVREEVEKKIEMYDKVAKKLLSLKNGKVMYIDTSDLTEVNVFHKIKEFING